MFLYIYVRAGAICDVDCTRGSARKCPEGDDGAPKDTTPEGSFLEPDPWCPFSWQLWDCHSFDICVWLSSVSCLAMVLGHDCFRLAACISERPP